MKRQDKKELVKFLSDCMYMMEVMSGCACQLTAEEISKKIALARETKTPCDGVPDLNNVPQEMCLEIHLKNGECIRLNNFSLQSWQKKDYCGDYIDEMHETQPETYENIDLIHVVAWNHKRMIFIPLVAINYVEFLVDDTESFVKRWKEVLEPNGQE